MGQHRLEPLADALSAFTPLATRARALAMTTLLLIRSSLSFFCFFFPISLLTSSSLTSEFFAPERLWETAVFVPLLITLAWPLAALLSPRCALRFTGALHSFNVFEVN